MNQRIPRVDGVFDRAKVIQPVGKFGSELSAAWNGVSSIRIIDFALFFLLITGLGLSVGFEQTNIVAAVVVICSLMRRPRFALGGYQWLVPVVVVALVYVGMVSMFATPTDGAADWRGRLLRMAVVSAMLFVIATGRIHMRSAVYGYCAALVVNVVLFYSGLVADNYGGYLTGLVGDKNVAGLSYCVSGILALAVARRKLHLAFLAPVFGMFVWLTGSRTSIAAFLCACIWVLVARHLPRLGKWILGVAMMYAVEITSEDFSQIGIFSSREGSDELRSRIDAASVIRVDESGFFGQGLGEAYVSIDDRYWFFHNSYWSALVEGGWPWLLFLVALTFFVLLRPFQSEINRGELYGQALGIALLICATRLGEVFYTTLWVVPLAFGLQVACAKRMGVDLDVDASISPSADPSGEVMRRV